MDKLTKARLALSSLTVYRNILNDKNASGFQNLLEAANGVDLRGFCEAYGVFLAQLSVCFGQIDFSVCIEELIKYDDNAFSRQAAGKPLSDIDELLLCAARHDLAAIGEVMGLSAADIKEQAVINFADDAVGEELIKSLPEFKTASGAMLGAAPDEALADIASFYSKNGCGQFAHYGAFKWRSDPAGGQLCGIENPDAISLSELKGYEYERGVVIANTLDFLEGVEANNLLLYGDRGTGKSSTVKAIFNSYRAAGLRIIEITKECIADFPLIVREIGRIPLKFIIFIDDLSFSSDDVNFSALKAVLEGGLAARPRNCVIYATSNRRHLVKESFSERESDDVHAADTMQEKLSLADRFGITITFSAPDQRLYFEIIGAMARDRGLKIPQQELERGAVQWALRFNGRSPRAARQYIDWAQSRFKKGLPVTNF